MVDSLSPIEMGAGLIQGIVMKQFHRMAFLHLCEATCADQTQQFAGDLGDSQLLSAGKLLLKDMSEQPLPYAEQASKVRRAVNNLNNALNALLKAELTLCAPCPPLPAQSQEHAVAGSERKARGQLMVYVLFLIQVDCAVVMHAP